MRVMVLIASVLPVLTACGQGAEEKAEAPPPAPVQANAAPEEEEEPVLIRPGGEVVVGLPEGIPGYPGAEAIGADPAGAAPRVLRFRTADSPSQVINYYGDRALRAGFAITAQMYMGERAELEAERGAETLAIAATRTGPATEIRITLGARSAAQSRQ